MPVIEGKDFKKVDISIDVENPALSKIVVDGELIENVFALTIKAGVDQGTAEVEFVTNGNELGVGEKGWSFYIKPHCPHCGTDGVRFPVTKVNENSVREIGESVSDGESYRISENTSLPETST